MQEHVQKLVELDQKAQKEKPDKIQIFVEDTPNDAKQFLKEMAGKSDDDAKGHKLNDEHVCQTEPQVVSANHDLKSCEGEGGEEGEPDSTTA